jgi:hypothetical protein
MVFHCDRALIKSYSFTPEGFLNYIAPIAKVGELVYYNQDGQRRTEYVTAETLKKSAESFKMKPITHQHPPGGRVTPKNAKDYQVGLTGHGVYFDGDFLWLTGTITDATAINAAITKDAAEISCGYDAVTVQRADGRYEQVERRGNHVAIVKRGRAGKDVSLRFDSSEELWHTSLKSQRGKGLLVKLDGKEFDIEDAELAVAVVGLNSRLDSAEGEKAAFKAKLDAAEGEKVALLTRIDSAEKATPTQEAIKELVKESLECWRLVTPQLRSDSADFEPDYSLSPTEIKTLYIKSKAPAVNLEGRSDAFIDGLWEGLKPDPSATKPTTNADSFYDALNEDGGAGEPDDVIAKVRKKRLQAIEENYKKEA